MNWAINLLKFFASIGIVLFHYSIDRNIIIDHLNVLIGLFFVLSGFLLKYSDKEVKVLSIGKFYRKRLIRIVPVYWLVLAPYLLFSDGSIKIKIMHSLLMQSWMIDSSDVLALNSPTWFLSVLILFYVLYPFLRNLDIRTLKIIQYVLFGFVIFSGEGELFYSPIFHLQLFVYGVRLANEDSIDNTDIFVTIILLSSFVYSDNLLVLHNGLFFVLWGILILGALRIGKRGKNRTLHIVSNFLGKISFAIYLLQAIVYAGLGLFFNFTDSAGFCVYLALLILVSIIFHLLFEVPITKGLIRILGPRQRR